MVVSWGLRGLLSRVRMAGLAVLLAPYPALAVSISYTATQIFGTSWQYDYVVTNDGTLGGGTEITGFQVFFDPALYQNLAVVSAPVQWDPIVFQPDADLFLPGVFDGLAIPGEGVAAGGSVNGFAVSFDWLPVGESPGSQPFLFYEDLTAVGCDPEGAEDCFPVLFPGGLLPPADAAEFLAWPAEALSTATAVPAPSALLLFVTAALGTSGGWRSRRTSRRK